MEQKYNIEQIEASAKSCNNVGKEVRFDESYMLDLNQTNAGDVKQTIDKIIQELSAVATDTQTYFLNTAQFIQSVAAHFEKMDKDLANKVKES